MVGGGKRGGEEEKETEGTRGREKEKPALIQSMGSIFAECVEGTGARLCHLYRAQPNHGVCGTVVMAGLVLLY